MSFRQDKLILLLETGTSAQVRRTAAKQLAELTVKTFHATITPRPAEPDDVKPDVDNDDTKVTLSASASEDDAWNGVLETVSKLLPLLRSKSSETRHATANALGLLAQSLPSYTVPVTDPSSSTSQPLDLAELLRSGDMLLASAGREYVAKPVNAADKAKRRKAMMGSLGLGDAVGWGEDVDKVIGEEDEEMGGAPKNPSPSPAVATPPSETPKDVFEGLSARQITMLKRKKGNIVEEANKLRRLNASSAGLGPGSVPPSAAPTPDSSPQRKPSALPLTPGPSSEAVTIDPGAKARAAAASGAVEPIMDADGNAITSNLPTLTMTSGLSPWVTILDEVEPGLVDPAWQARHGSALSVMEIVRYVGSALPRSYLLDLGRSLLTLLVLDRFGDFVGDTVMAPVRETAAQALGVMLKYLDDPAIYEVHSTLVAMVRQPWAKRGKEGANAAKGEKFAWGVRHAGLLGLKYEVAVRSDLLGVGVKAEDGEDVKPKIEENGYTTGRPDLLKDVVESAILAMQDVDDDVRSVAASALLPITEALASRLQPSELSALLDTLWNCLAADTDDLGSSTGAIMDLLGTMINHKQVIAEMSGDYEVSDPRSRHNRISRMYPYLRHTIPSVRLAVVKALHTFTTVQDLPRNDWMYNTFFALIFQNLVLEERADIRDLSFATFSSAVHAAEYMDGALDAMVRPSLEEWYEIVMTPIGSKFDDTLFVKGGKASSGHNVDKHIMAGDLSLVPMETMLATRIAGAKALASLLKYFREASDVKLLQRYLRSASAHQIFLASVVIQEWAQDVDSRSAGPLISLGATDQNGQELAKTLVALVEAPPAATYHEMTLFLRRVQAECQALLNAFVTDGGVKKDKIPDLPTVIDPSTKSSSVFSLATAQTAVGPHFDALSKLVSKVKAKTALPALADRQRKVMASIGYFGVMKERYDIQVSTAICGALIALRVMPAKFGPVVKNVMDGVKKEENEVLQVRAAASVASFVEFCNSPLFTGKNNPSDKIVKNLFTFLCQDVAVTPVFSVNSSATEGILSLKEEKPVPVKKTAAGLKEIPDETEEQISSRLTRRGALEAFRALAKKFGSRLFESVPKYWEGLSAALLATFASGISIDDVDSKLSGDLAAGQELIDALTSLRLIAPELDPSLHEKMTELFPFVIAALSSSFSVVRSTAAKCLAALCDVVTEHGMRLVVDTVVPLVGDAKRTASRQGAVEAIHHIIKLLDMKVLPYVLFLIVPILGRMSDPDESTRLLSTSTFAALVKMVPLEAGIPDPPGFSPELLAKRDDERKFLMQLLDGSKAEQYEIPIDIKADLRQYQRDGVSWLAFLAKYQLHGILCDDMGLGKSLQSICIVGSKHHERATKHKQTGSVDSAHLPSLIVCPPTLTGHWYYEILKFTDYLRPMQYVGNQWERSMLRQKITSPDVDVVIMSYEAVRADIAELSKIDWLYCVLDEGHIIKNAKTKLSAAVKQIKAQHRLLLSGTPIQNNVLELWSLFDFLMPGFLGSERVFNDKFSKPILADRDGKATPKERDAAAAALEALHKQVLPFLLRRLKEDVLHDLPPKIIQDYYCELSTVQKALYDEFSKSRAAEEAGEAVTSEGQPGQGHVFQSLQYLRKLCNHPALVLDGEEGQARWGEVVKKVGGGLPPLSDLSHAPKLEALRQLLNDCGIGLPASDKLGGVEETPQHRVLIFCQLRPMLDIIERDLFGSAMSNVRYMRMDGSTDPRKRQAVVQTFNADARIDVLLLTTSVGGLGLNLTGADTVIFVDHDWNPMKDLQAMDRAHRLGQKKVVNVYRLITRGTLEEKIMGLQRFKLNIASSVVTQQNAGLGSMNTGEVLDLFKISSEPEGVKPAKPSNGPVSASKVLEGLEDLPAEDEYAELSLSNFMSKV